MPIVTMDNFQDNSVYRCHQLNAQRYNSDDGAVKKPINRLI